MMMRRLIGSVALSGGLSLALAGGAFADDVVIQDTGPSSDNHATITNNNSVTETNTNNVTVTNTNNQTATTGDAEVSHNTNAGSAQSGDAMNSNTVATTVAINNPSVVPGSGGAGGNGGGGNPGVGNTSGNAGGSSAVVGKGGASVGTGGGAGVGVLPKTGPSNPIDVSALRALYQLPTAASLPTAVVQRANATSALLLTLAALLSFAGAAGTALYASKRVKV